MHTTSAARMAAAIGMNITVALMMRDSEGWMRSGDWEKHVRLARRKMMIPADILSRKL